jgi:hypothetical protein
MASKVKGARVILCTDGLANVGVGALDCVASAAKQAADAAREAAGQQQQNDPQVVVPPGGATVDNQENEEEEAEEDEVDRVEKFYDSIGTQAQLGGVTVSLISIADAECRLENLGRVADLTGGDVQRINALQLTSNFNNILEKPIIATNVQAVMLIHSGLRFCKEIDSDEVVTEGKENSKQQSDSENKDDSGEEKEQGGLAISRQTQDIGNAFADTECYFEYELNDKTKHLVEKLSRLPFQVQITYTQLDGARCVRVMSQCREITTDRSQSLAQANMALVAAHAAKKSASLAQKGLYNQSRICNMKHAIYLNQNAVTPAQMSSASAFTSHSSTWDSMLHQQQQSESLQTKSGFSFFKGKKSKSAAQRKSRAVNRSDGVSSAMYAAKKCNSSGFM